jgi:hypothetical protein
VQIDKNEDIDKITDTEKKRNLKEIVIYSNIQSA